MKPPRGSLAKLWCCFSQACRRAKMVSRQNVTPKMFSRQKKVVKDSLFSEKSLVTLLFLYKDVNITSASGTPD
jgi:hypothetical protein